MDEREAPQLRQEQLTNLQDLVGPEQLAVLIAAANRLHASVMNSAESIAAIHPGQFQRFLDGIAALASSIDAIPSNPRPIDITITKLRRAVMDVGFGKFVNSRTGKQEFPED